MDSSPAIGRGGGPFSALGTAARAGPHLAAQSAVATSLPGINGTITSSSATFGWFSPIVYHDVQVSDAAGNVLLSVATIQSEKPLVYLATHPRTIGGLRLERPTVNIEMCADGSNAEDILAPLFAPKTSGGGVGMTLEIVDGTIALHDVAADKQTRIEACQTLLRFVPESPCAGGMVARRRRRR